MNTRILQPIGKGQITIPREWRAFLDIDQKPVMATLNGNKIIIEILPLKEKEKWEIEHISLNKLQASEKRLIQKGRKAYKKGGQGKFLTTSEFFKNV